MSRAIRSVPAIEPPAAPSVNVARRLLEAADAAPERIAVVGMRGRRCDSITFAELERLSCRLACGLGSAGIARGMRVLLMVRPGIEFFALMFALFRLGAVPVLIDPGMGVRRLLACVWQVDVEAFIGIPLAQLVRVLRPAAFANVRHVVTVGRRLFWGGASLEKLCRGAPDRFGPADMRSDETAAILFTSGSTGPAKGVVYEHGMFDAQIDMIRSHYGMRAGDVDVATFPLFALFSAAMGITAVIPDMDASRPSRAKPQNIIRAVQDHRAVNAFGSPALWSNVADYCSERGITLPTLRRVLVFGAPVPRRTIARLQEIIGPEGDVFTPYGATESLPVASVSGRELHGGLSEKSACGAGTCVGRPVSGTDVRIIRITDEAIPEWSDDLLVSAGQIGEIAVAGPVVTKEYYGLSRATELAKIRDGERIWHRVGDVGYFDDAGRLWFCGRKSQRVATERGTMYTECCEPIFNEHTAVARSALVGVGPPGRQRPVLIVERRRTRARIGRAQLRQELLALATRHDTTRPIREILFHRRLPVDVRHNAKINRESLAPWAKRNLK